MIRLAVLGCLLAWAAAQVTRETPPHTLAMPKTWKLGVEQSISLTVYDWTFRRRDIIVTIHQKICTCVRRPRFQRRCGPSTVFSEARVESNPGVAAILNIRLPNHNEVTDREFSISVTSSVGESFVSSRRIYFSNPSRGMMAVRTDKPIYKPGQTVKFCILAMDAMTRPRAATVVAEIKDYRNRLIEKFSSVKIPDTGYFCQEFQLADRPPIGVWKINVRETVDTGSCSNYYGSMFETCNFEVKEFVLPKFEVSLKGPKFLTREVDEIVGEISAEYVFDEPVEGKVVINFTLAATRRSENFLFHTIQATLEDGKYAFRVPSEEYRRILRYRFDPFCVASAVLITAEVEEMGRGTKYSSDIRFPLVANQVSFKYDEEMKETFKPGLEYTIKVRSENHDGSPAPKETFTLTVTANNGEVTIVKPKKRRTSKSGSFEITIKISANINCMRILITPLNGEFSCEEGSVCFSPVPAHSPSNCFLHMEVSNKKPKEGETLNVAIKSTQPMSYLQCMVVSQGMILAHSTHSPGGSALEYQWDMEVTCQHSPRFQILCYYARQDGEVCGDIVELTMDCCSPHKVGMDFHRSKSSSLIDADNGDTARPQARIYVNVTADPRTPVLVSVFDKSLSLLADFCDSGKQSSICRKLDGTASGSVSIGTSCSVAQKLQCKPVEWDEVRRIDITRILGFLGVSVTSNMYLPRAPSVTTPAPPRPVFKGVLEDGLAVPLVARTFSAVTTPPGPPPPSEGPSGDNAAEDNQVRRFFPESWLFSVVETNDDGEARLDTTTPDTITTWHGEAIALSKDSGIGFSGVTPLTVFKPFFVSLELPYCIVFGERVTIKPVLFNFWDQDVKASLSVDTDVDLTVLSDLPSLLTIPAKSSATFDLTVLARCIGRLRITITARVNAKKFSDTVEKELFVKPGCVRYERVSSVFISGKDEQKSHTFSFSLPSCTIPKSHKATVVVKGDLMLVPNLNNLLVVPYGCGEQNMAKMAFNYVVGNYLDQTGQLTDAIEARIMANLRTGYQRQLNYQLFTGAFTVWPNAKPSTWLTAFVLRYLSAIYEFNGGASFVDVGVMRGAFNYLLRVQNSTDGSFTSSGYITNFRLLNDDLAMTAYVLTTLKRYPITDSRKDRAIENALDYLRNYTLANSESLCPYSLVIAAYHLPKEASTLRPLIPIRSSLDYPGTCYVCNTCESRYGREEEEETATQDEDCPDAVPKKDPVSTECIETTAYAILALLKTGDIDQVTCLAQWLLKQQNSLGGFGSTQDTIVALEALAAFAKESYTKALDLTVNIPDGNVIHAVDVTRDNSYTNHEVMISNVPGTVEVSWSGVGTAIVQSVLTYHGCNCCNGSTAFGLEVEKSGSDKIVDLYITFNYNGGVSSNMAILDVELPSGCIFEDSKVTMGDASIDNTEVSGSSVVLYLEKVTGRDSVVRVTCERSPMFVIANFQPAPVTIYDYYLPTKRVTVFYNTDI